MGRTRLDASLVGEIAAALEEDEHQGAAWARRARRARPRQEPELPPSSETQQPAPPPEVPAAADSDPEQATSPLSSDENSEQASAAQTPPAAAPSSPQVRRRWVVPIMPVCLAVNLLGCAAVGRLPLPLHLDMVGTAMAARRWAMTRTPARFLVLSLGSAVVCTIVALPLLRIFFDAHTGHTTDGSAADFEARGLPPLGAALTGNLFTSVADRLISGVIALVAVSLLPAARHFSQGIRSTD